MRGIGSVLMVVLTLHQPSTWAGAELLLEDGQVLEGETVELKDGLYLLALGTGGVLPIPADLVAKIELTGDDAEPPTGIRPAEPETLVGPYGAAELPTRAEQLEVLAHGVAQFRRGVIDPTWHPVSDWELSNANNEFNPARWYKAPIDPGWTPRSDYKRTSDVTSFNPADWYRPPIDPIWRPTDGFGWRDR